MQTLFCDAAVAKSNVMLLHTYLAIAVLRNCATFSVLFFRIREEITGRQLPPLSSVLYRIISKRRYILAAQVLLREKSGT